MQFMHGNSQKLQDPVREVVSLTGQPSSGPASPDNQESREGTHGAYMHPIDLKGF